MINRNSELRRLKPENSFFVGIDSDGCAFDTMEIKQKECFCPNFISHFGFESIDVPVREVWEFVNLYSRHRGINRFLAVAEVLRLLPEHPALKNRRCAVPDPTPLLDWLESGAGPGEPSLAAYVQECPLPILATALKWSRESNESVERRIQGIFPFPHFQESLKAIESRADIMVVSQSPLATLEREWENLRRKSSIRFLAGQELGSKTEHLKMMISGKYDRKRALMIGDAPGDLLAAEENGILFYPIIPGREDESWKRFSLEGAIRFFNGTFCSGYQQRLRKEFLASLPTEPPWASGPEKRAETQVSSTAAPLPVKRRQRNPGGLA